MAVEPFLGTRTQKAFIATSACSCSYVHSPFTYDFPQSSYVRSYPSSDSLGLLTSVYIIRGYCGAYYGGNRIRKSGGGNQNLYSTVN